MIRALESRDIVSCLAMVRAAYDITSARYAEIELNQSLAPIAPKPTFKVYEAHGAGVVGFAGYGPSGVDFGVWSLIWVNVAIPMRNRGIGAALVAHCLSDLAQLATTALIATTIPDWYAKHWGFKTVYAYGGDHYLMCRVLE